MSTKKDFIEYIGDQLHDPDILFRAMFGEYAMYYRKKVVALVCDNTLYLKITPSNQHILENNERGPAYPGAKDSYVIDGDQIEDRELLRRIIMNVFEDLNKIK